jgi:hypothetical protein
MGESQPKTQAPNPSLRHPPSFYTVERYIALNEPPMIPTSTKSNFDSLPTRSCEYRATWI